MQKTQTQTRTRISVNAALVELFSFSCHVESYVFTCVLFVVVSERLLLKESAMNFRVFLRVGLAKIPTLVHLTSRWIHWATNVFMWFPPFAGF